MHIISPTHIEKVKFVIFNGISSENDFNALLTKEMRYVC